MRTHTHTLTNDEHVEVCVEIIHIALNDLFKQESKKKKKKKKKKKRENEKKEEEKESTAHSLTHHTLTHTPLTHHTHTHTHIHSFTPTSSVSVVTTTGRPSMFDILSLRSLVVCHHFFFFFLLLVLPLAVRFATAGRNMEWQNVNVGFLLLSFLFGLLPRKAQRCAVEGLAKKGLRNGRHLLAHANTHTDDGSLMRGSVASSALMCEHANN